MLDQFNFQLQQNQGAQVSAFYHDEAHQRDSSGESRVEEKKDEELRLPHNDSLTDLQCKETEISQPIMQLMHIHQQMGAAQNHRFSNASLASNSHNYISEENPAFMMGISDEF